MPAQKWARASTRNVPPFRSLSEVLVPRFSTAYVRFATFLQKNEVINLPRKITKQSVVSKGLPAFIRLRKEGMCYKVYPFRTYVQWHRARWKEVGVHHKVVMLLSLAEPCCRCCRKATDASEIDPCFLALTQPFQKDRLLQKCWMNCYLCCAAPYMSSHVNPAQFKKSAAQFRGH